MESKHAVQKLSGELFNQGAITDWEFARFRQLIFDLAGITLSEHKKNLVAVRLASRLRYYSLTSFADYYRMLMNDPPQGELQTVVDHLTTNETHFFREPRHFGFIKRHILDNITSQRPLRCWSAVCSTGEEPYSLAMLLADHCGYSPDWRVLGSDINANVLEQAQSGLYLNSRQAEIPKRYLQQFCLKGVRSQQGTLLINSKVREHVRFKQINLNTSLPNVGFFDLILLRNVLIYFSAETKHEVVLRVVEKLKPGGHILVGHSETITGISDQLRLIKPSIYQKV
ncbi:CheR family methyltransferase [Photobacterium alginatilyticum]|uniref:Chemotaxis protein methyltransferase n=1 Tax=Photobacterium alginatilyticum TaxID=1775171 RepID=A0ABW9YG20_9GAMM|nr:protein-glutamate O-methyltransferase CheR [Photobacterium alginatilyticum]NBI52747.1 protein-glutamate O-methyltransferase CheR [Photobacterium alginatilyticum]